MRFRYRREAADGSSNETTSQKSFEKWLKEPADGDKFYVAWCRWVECRPDGTVRFGDGELRRIAKVGEVDAKENA